VQFLRAKVTLSIVYLPEEIQGIRYDLFVHSYC
jgi:hypothetical protein